MKCIMKENAKEYLKEFATSQDNWLKAIVYEAIETNGDIADEREKEIFQHLSKGTQIDINEPNIDTVNLLSEIFITSIHHKNGVNALKVNQKIKFNNEVTILYGLNGTGKSSYFKVLNEIVGGNQKKKILSNIYSETVRPINVEIKFEEKGNQNHTINWDGSNRSLDLLNKCKVFDTSYLYGLLETRQADSTLIQPLGLNLFAYIVRLIDKFKEGLNKEADKNRLTKSVLELKYLSDEIKTSFENHSINNLVKRKIEDLYIFSEENIKKLEEIKKELSDLKQINIQDKINLRNNDKAEIADIIKYIETTNNSILDFVKKTEGSIKINSENLVANKSARKQFDILTNIPANNTDEWKEFIKAGENYTSKIENEEGICAYCRQPLKDDNSINLVKAYGKFLKDESEQKLTNSKNKIDSLIQQVDRFSTELILKENTVRILKEYRIGNSTDSLFQGITNKTNEFTSVRNKLVELLNEKNADVKIELSDISGIINQLSPIVENIKIEIDILSQDNSKKKEKIIDAETKLKNLLENESIYKQKDEIKKWFLINEEEARLRKKASKINTRKISDLSKVAHNDLLTETLKTNFLDELSGLGCSNLGVKIENARGHKGTSNTKLSLTKNNDIKTILSEGEQKAVALALFITEVKIQKSLNPIILDDPVNSLDHKIASKFAEQILKLDNQIILFNHNKLFLEAFETSKENHICKTIDSDCNTTRGKHIRVYQVDSEGKNSKGVLTNYKRNKAKVHIGEGKRLLRQSPFTERLKVASLLRKAVECTIDEVIFCNQTPTKNSTKYSHIDWDGLTKLNNDSTIIEKLKTVHGRVSGGEMHNGTENEENPIEVEEFNDMFFEIENILN